MKIIFDEDKFVKNPLLSVCIITYNHEKYITKAIEGVIMQETEFPFEIIIAEDFSTDNTRNILIAYQQKYPHLIKLLLQEKNVGAAENWRDLITHPKTKYIAYFEADDYWIDSYKLEKQVAFLQANPNYGACFTDADILYESSNKIIRAFDSSNNKIIPSGDVLKSIIYYNPYKTCTVLFKTNPILKDVFKIIEQNDFQVGDWPLWIHISEYSNIGYLSIPTATYRVNDNSGLQSTSISKNIAFCKNADHISNFYCKKYNIKNSLFKRKLNMFRTLLSIIRGKIRKKI